MNIHLLTSGQFTPADFAALFLLFVSWLYIGWQIEHPPVGKPSVSILMKRFRREWMEQFITRDPRIFDGNILASLREGTAFFASASMIAIGGGLAMMGNADRLQNIASDLELRQVSADVIQLKLLVPMFFVVNAFLKFVWAHRLFGYCAILMAAVPNSADHPMASERAAQAADLNITSARSFNGGLRSVYFAIGALGWLAGPWALLLTTLAVLFVTWRREFASNSRKVIMRSLPAPQLPVRARPTESE